MTRANKYFFESMKIGVPVGFVGECPVKKTKSKLHIAFYRYATRKGWKIKTTVDRDNDILILERVA